MDPTGMVGPCTGHVRPPVQGSRHKFTGTAHRLLTVFFFTDDSVLMERRKPPALRQFKACAQGTSINTTRFTTTPSTIHSVSQHVRDRAYIGIVA